MTRKRIFLTLYICALTLFTSFALFFAIELRPSLIDAFGLHRIRYYLLKKTDYPSDPKLVFTRGPSAPVRARLSGDLYRTEYGDPEPFDYAATYTPEGFRSNSSAAPYEMVVIGDSFVEIGEDDSMTLSERLKAETGLSTFNLGRGWYGPHQYVELLRRYGLGLRPRFAVLCIFAGNDIEDIRQYEQWAKGGDYYYYKDLARLGLLRRYTLALADTASLAVSETRRRVYLMRGRGGSDLAYIRLGSDERRMAFMYWNAEGTKNDLLCSEQWRTLKSLLAEFRNLCLSSNITPIYVYVPSKVQVYGEMATDRSGESFKKLWAAQSLRNENASEALTLMAAELNVKLVNLLPEFKRRARAGSLLYYPFDTHWNSEGIKAAAQTIGAALPQVEGRESHARDALKPERAPDRAQEIPCDR